jgi:predicted nucleic acid-binding Zn ribbon protein
MSLKVFDFECEDCELTRELFVEDGQEVSCPGCHGLMKKCMPSVGLICPTPPGLSSGPLKEGGRKLR